MSLSAQLLWIMPLVAAVRRLMTDSRVKRSRGVGQRNAGQLAALDEFVKCAGKLELSLGAREAAFLNGLSTSVQ